MKIFRNILLVILALLAIPFIGLLFMEEDYAVERNVVINAPSAEVFDYIKYLKNQDNYSKWSTMDPDMEKKYVGEDGKVGFISKWNSTNEEVGVGEQEIIKIEEGKRIDFELRFYEPFQSTEDAYMVVEPIDSSRTKVYWGFSGSFDYPSNAMLLFIDFEEAIGNDFDQGLAKLKEILENR